MSDNNIIFKGVQNGILIILDENMPFDELKECLANKVENAKIFFKDANISITFKGKELTEDEEIELLKVISKKSGIEISFLNDNSALNSIEDENEDIETDIIENLNMITEKNNMTYYHKGSVRSGQKLEYSGSIVVLGDVNPGAEILAEGNIIILGKLKGVAHAGCKGASDCYIFSLHMNPTQLIIGNCLSYFPKDLEREFIPEYAYVKDDKIFVESFN